MTTSSGHLGSIISDDPVGMVLVRGTAHSLSLRHGQSYICAHDVPGCACLSRAVPSRP